MAFEKLFWCMTWGIIYTSSKKTEVGCIPSSCKLRNAWRSRRFIWLDREPAWTGTFLYTQNASWVCEAWVPVCYPCWNISYINQMHTDTTGVSWGHFRHSFHWDATLTYPAILFLPMSNASLHILEFFPLPKKKKKNALCSLLSLDQKALLLMKRNLKNHSLFVFPCPVPPSDIFHWGRCLPGILLSLSLSQKLYFFCCFWSMKDVCWVGKSSEIF